MFHDIYDFKRSWVWYGIYLLISSGSHSPHQPAVSWKILSYPHILITPPDLHYFWHFLAKYPGLLTIGEQNPPKYGGICFHPWWNPQTPKLISWLVGGWTNPFEKYARQNGFIFPNFRGENSKNIWNHHPVDLLGVIPLDVSRDRLHSAALQLRDKGQELLGRCQQTAAFHPLNQKISRGIYVWNIIYNL